MPEFLLIAALLAGMAVAGVIAFGPRMLLGWYLREIRDVKVPEDPGDKIVTYPLA